MGAVSLPRESGEDSDKRRAERLEKQRAEEKARFEEARRIAEENARRKAEEERRKTEFRDWKKKSLAPLLADKYGCHEAIVNQCIDEYGEELDDENADKEIETTLLRSLGSVPLHDTSESFTILSPRTVHDVFEKQGAQVLAEATTLEEGLDTESGLDLMSPRLEKFLSEGTSASVSHVKDGSRCSACGLQNKLPFKFCKGCGAANGLGAPIPTAKTSTGSKFVQRKKVQPFSKDGDKDAAAVPVSPRTLTSVFADHGAQVLAEASALETVTPGGSMEDVMSPRLEKFLLQDSTTPHGEPAPQLPDNTRCVACGMRNKPPFKFCKGCGIPNGAINTPSPVVAADISSQTGVAWVAAKSPSEKAVDLVQTRADLLAQAEAAQRLAQEAAAREEARRQAEIEQIERHEAEQRNRIAAEEERRVREAEEQRKASETALLIHGLEADSDRLRRLTALQEQALQSPSKQVLAEFQLQQEKLESERKAKEERDQILPSRDAVGILEGQPIIMDDTTPLIGGKGKKKPGCCCTCWLRCCCCCCRDDAYDTL